MRDAGFLNMSHLNTKTYEKPWIPAPVKGADEVSSDSSDEF